MDGCLYSPLTHGDRGRPNPSHNRNLGAALKIAQKLALPAHNKGLCGSIDDCTVDLVALGAITAIEAAEGPSIPMRWGRRKGNCTRMVVTPFRKDDGSTYDAHPALRSAPALTGIDNAQHFRDTFQSLGFSATDQAALMGAHSFGKLQVCAGGMNGIEKGPWCNNRSMLDPAVGSQQLLANGCTPVVGVVKKCWKVQNSRLLPVFAGKDGSTKTGFGDGGFFDRTPQKFDNDYFKLFAQESYDGKDICCGKIKGGRCHRRGTMVNLVTGQAAGTPCEHNWCRSDRKGRTHMKSLKAWEETEHDFVKKGWHHGVTKRMVRLAGDWALLGIEETRDAVVRFAADQSEFFAAFSSAFSQVLSMGHAQLNQCSS